MKKISFIIIFIFFVCISGFTIPTSTLKPVVVIATFDAKGFVAEDVEFIMSIFTSNFANLGVANIVDRTHFDKIKKELSFQDSDWSDSNKVAELGHALNANQVAVGQIMKRGSAVFLVVKILDVNTTTIIASHSDRATSIDDFFDKMPEFCKILVGKASAAPPVTLSTSSMPTGKKGAVYVKSNEYKIGDEGPGGGIIFYVSEEGFKVHDGMGGEMVCYYFEMSRETLGLSKWTPDNSTVKTQDGLGCGKANTYNILHVNSSKILTDDNCAAYRANRYSTSSTKAGEWWLPSKAELALMFQNQKDIILGTCKDKYHWSSSESGSDKAWLQHFSTGSQYSYFKTKSMDSVRAVRAF